MIDKNMCDKFKHIRRSLDFTQVTFSKMLEISRTVIADIENYRIDPSKKMIKSVIDKFDINPSWLYLGEGEMLSKGRGNRIAEQPRIYNKATPQQIEGLLDKLGRLEKENANLKNALLALASNQANTDLLDLLNQMAIDIGAIRKKLGDPQQ